MAMEWLKNLFSMERATAPAAIQPGLYHAVQGTDGNYTRFHLRVELDGSGMLVANATAAARLTPVGVIIVKGLLDGASEKEILKKLAMHFQGATEAVMLQDVAKVQALISQIVAPSDLYPVFNLDDAAISPYAAQLIAPLQATLPAVAPEKTLLFLDRLWEIGVPHVTLLVPEQPQAEHLLRAVERAEDLGMIAGVRGRATDLLSGTLLPDLVQAGVDHVTFIYAGQDAQQHDALCGEGDHAAALEVLAWLEEHQVCAMAEIPLLQTTVDALDSQLEYLISLGVDNISFVAYVTPDVALAQQDGVFAADAMPQVATMVEEATDAARARFIWNPPLQRNPALSLAQQLRQGPRCSGDVAVRVTEDGEVIPSRGPLRSAGNLLKDSWESIWEHEVFRVYRERVEAPTHCDVCPGLAICAADCPREPSGWAQDL